MFQRFIASKPFFYHIDSSTNTSSRLHYLCMDLTILTILTTVFRQISMLNRNFLQNCVAAHVKRSISIRIAQNKCHRWNDRIEQQREKKTENNSCRSANRIKFRVWNWNFVSNWLDCGVPLLLLLLALHSIGTLGAAESATHRKILVRSALILRKK